LLLERPQGFVSSAANRADQRDAVFAPRCRGVLAASTQVVEIQR
jgi:hypothetical protein